MLYAQVGDQNLVTNVIVIDPGNENPNDFIAKTLGLPGIWLETSEGGPRKNQAGVGYTYSEELDAFIPPKPYNSWLLDEVTCTWMPPVPEPTDMTKVYDWNEDTLSWEDITPTS